MDSRDTPPAESPADTPTASSESETASDGADSRPPGLPLSRRGALGAVVGIGGLSLLGSARGNHRGPHWQKDVDARGNALFDLGALSMRDDPTEIRGFAGSNLSIDDDGVLDARDTHATVSDDGSEVLADADDINFGSNLDASPDGDGSVTVDATGGGHTFETRTLESAGTSWAAVTGLSGETPVEVTVDTVGVTRGRCRVDVDGSLEAAIGAGDVLHRVVGPTDSLTVSSLGEPAFEDSVEISGHEDRPTGIAFRGDGSRMYVVGIDFGFVHSFALGTPWDISTATHLRQFSVEDEDPGPTGLAFSDDGTKMVVSGGSGDTVFSYALSTPWDVSTASVDDSFDLTPRRVAPRGIAFGDDGSNMYVIDQRSGIISFSLSNPWDIHDPEVQGFLRTRADVPDATGIAFDAGGRKVYVCGDNRRSVVVYFLSTPWDVSTGTLNDDFPVSVRALEPTAVAFGDDDARMFVTGRTSGLGEVHSYAREYTGTAYATVKRE